jgi:hypothetical protein
MAAGEAVFGAETGRGTEADATRGVDLVLIVGAAFIVGWCGTDDCWEGGKEEEDDDEEEESGGGEELDGCGELEEVGNRREVARVGEEREGIGAPRPGFGRSVKTRGQQLRQ